MEEEPLSDENSIKDGSYNILSTKNKSKMDVTNNESLKETITITDTDNNNSSIPNSRMTKPNNPVIGTLGKSSRNDPLSIEKSKSNT